MDDEGRMSTRDTLSVAAKDVRVGDLIYDPAYFAEPKWRPVRSIGDGFGQVALHLSYVTFVKHPDEGVVVRRA